MNNESVHYITGCTDEYISYNSNEKIIGKKVLNIPHTHNSINRLFLIYSITMMKKWKLNKFGFIIGLYGINYNISILFNIIEYRNIYILI